MISPADLKPASGRWTASRKAAVVDAVRRGDLPREAVLRDLDLSAEELAGWEHSSAAGGRRALQANHSRRA